MINFVYKITIFFTKLFGLWFFKTIAWIIAAGFFFFSPGVVKISKRFYRNLFPGKSSWYYARCAWKQFHSFTNVYIDRFVLQQYEDVTYTENGWKHLEQAVDNKTGGVLVMSHVGNWDVAAHLLKKEGLKLLLYMGIKEKEQIEGRQKQDLAASGVKIIAVDKDGGSPLDLIEGIKFLQEGGLVSMTGDRIWRQDQRAIAVDFLGKKVKIPEVPYLLALLSGSPLFFFFAHKTGHKKFHFTASEPLSVKASRKERKQAIQKAAQAYADALAAFVKERPFDWYHFEDFLGDSG